jgi:hypothetical protein
VRHLVVRKVGCTMSEEPFALSTIPPQPVAAEGDFDAICETVKASERGRWFLEEYARRNRNADTTQVLAAIGRIEGVVRGGRDREAYHSVRADLLDMARTIAVTRAEVAETKVEAAPEAKHASEPRAAATSEVFAMAERIQDVAWTMRERGIDPRTCEQIEALARAILSASSLRDPNDHRVGKLGEVLHYLERRIEGMLDAVAAEAAARQTHADAPAEAPVEPAVETAADDSGPEAVAVVAADDPAADLSHEVALDPAAPAHQAVSEPPAEIVESVPTIEAAAVGTRGARHGRRNWRCADGVGGFPARAAASPTRLIVGGSCHRRAGTRTRRRCARALGWRRRAHRGNPAHRAGAASGAADAAPARRRVASRPRSHVRRRAGRALYLSASGI